MELLIGILLLGLIGLVVFFFKFSSDDAKQQQNTDDAKARKISDLETEMARKDVEMKKMMEERQKLEEEFFKVKDQVDIFKKENSELMVKIKALEKIKEESGESKTDLKQKDMMLQQETVARQKLQGEVSLKEMELEKMGKELESLKTELKTKTQMFDGLKGQYNEIEAELQKVREDALKKKEPKSEPISEPKPEPKPEVKPEVKPEIKPEVKQEHEEIPGFPKQADVKIGIGQGVPKDTDFLKAEPAKDAGKAAGDIAEGAFKLTNVNKPAAEKKEAPKVAPGKPQEKDKSKSKREVLIDGFHPKPPPHPQEQP
jgi:archaellum component FlaC